MSLRKAPPTPRGEHTPPALTLRLGHAPGVALQDAGHCHQNGVVVHTLQACRKGSGGEPRKCSCCRGSSASLRPSPQTAELGLACQAPAVWCRLAGSGSTAPAEEARPAACWVPGFWILTRQPQGDHTVKEVPSLLSPGSAPD